ncbi:Nocturnin [Plasmodiophora brassicae]
MANDELLLIVVASLAVLAQGTAPTGEETKPEVSAENQVVVNRNDVATMRKDAVNEANRKPVLTPVISNHRGMAHDDDASITVVQWNILSDDYFVAREIDAEAVAFAQRFDRVAQVHGQGTPELCCQPAVSPGAMMLD